MASPCVGKVDERQLVVLDGSVARDPGGFEDRAADDARRVPERVELIGHLSLGIATGEREGRNLALRLPLRRHPSVAISAA